MKYTIELYTPAAKAGLRLLPMPLPPGRRLVASCDLKADRKRGALLVEGGFLEPGRTAHELRQIAAWLQLDRVEVADGGDLAGGLRRSGHSMMR